MPFVELHLSNIFAREPERRHTVLASSAVGMLCGFGPIGYELALRGLVARLAAPWLTAAPNDASALREALARRAPRRGAAHQPPQHPLPHGLLGLERAGARHRARDARSSPTSATQTQVRDEVGDFARVAIEPASLWTGLWQLLPELTGVKLVGFESAHVLHRDFERLLNAGARWQWRPTNDLVETLRERKDPQEIERIAGGGGRRARARSSARVPQVRAGMTELAIAGVLEQSLRAEGSEGFPFETIVASGPRSALPHARAADREVRRGDFLLIDFGAIVGGYCSDVTRTFVIGRASRRAARGLRHRARRERARVGERARGDVGRDADALARQYIEQRGSGRSVRPQPRPRHRARSARGTTVVEDRGSAAACAGGRHDRAGDLSRRVGRRAHRGRCRARPRRTANSDVVSARADGNRVTSTRAITRIGL